LFFTRWITNICAPVFFLLTGTGAALSLGRKTKSELSRFLWTRGLWLIFLEIVVLRCFAWQFNFDFHLTLLVVIWALGWAMITLAVLVYLPLRVIAAFSVIVIVTHNLLDTIPPGAFGKLLPLFLIFHSPGLLWQGPVHAIFVAYPLIPWVGVTSLGFCLGRVFSWEVAIVCVSSAAVLWTRAAFLLLSACCSDSQFGGSNLLRALRACLLDVPIAGSWELSVHAATRLGIWPAHNLPAVGDCGDGAVSGVLLVCGVEAAPARCLAELYLAGMNL
jgi:uncharacterized membrane protein